MITKKKTKKRVPNPITANNNLTFPQGNAPMKKGGMIKRYDDGGPIITNNPKDPRLKAYNDSLSLFNDGAKRLNRLKSALGDSGKNITSKVVPYNQNRSKVNQEEYDKSGIKPVGFEQITTSGSEDYEGKSYEWDSPLYKKPVQPVVYQKKQFIKPSYKDFLKTTNPDYLSNDYNLEEAYKNLPLSQMQKWAKDPENNHLPDTYKLPNHPTFSNESKYYKQGMKAGYWQGDNYIPLKEGENVLNTNKVTPTPIPIQRQVPQKPIPNPIQAKTNYGQDIKSIDSLMMPNGSKIDKDTFIKQHGIEQWNKATNVNNDNSGFQTKYMAKGGMIRKYGIGGFLQNLGTTLGNTALGIVGQGHLLDKNFTNDQEGRGFKNISNTTSALGAMGGQLAATAIGGPVAGSLFGQLQGLKFDNGGIIPEGQTMINVEGGELEVDDSGKIIKDFRNKPKHPANKSLIDSEGNTIATEGNTIIPKNMAKKFKEGDTLTRQTMITNLKKMTADNERMGKGGWIKGAVNPAHKGYCTPMSKSTCTGHRKAFAEMMKKKHGFHKMAQGGIVRAGDGYNIPRSPDGTPDYGAMQLNDMNNQTKSGTGGTGFNWMNALGTGLNLLGPASYLLGEGKSYDKVNYGSVSPDLIDGSQMINDANTEANSANKNIASASGGNSGLYLANRTQSQNSNTEAKSRIRSGILNTNAGIKNQFKQFNKQLDIQSQQDTAANKGTAQTAYYAAMANLGQNAAGAIGDYNQQQEQNKWKSKLPLMYDYFRLFPEILK